MGQAKLKGTFEQRQANAIERSRAQFPVSVKCNNCGDELTDIQGMDVRGMPEMRLVGAAMCENCSSTTWILDGTPEAIDQFQAFMASKHGEDAQVGFVDRPKR